MLTPEQINLLKQLKHAAYRGNCYVVVKTDQKGVDTFILYRSNGPGMKGTSVAKTTKLDEFSRIVKKAVKSD